MIGDWLLAPLGALVVVTVLGVSPTHPFTQSTFWWRCYLQLWWYFYGGDNDDADDCGSDGDYYCNGDDDDGGNDQPSCIFQLVATICSGELCQYLGAAFCPSLLPVLPVRPLSTTLSSLVLSNSQSRVYGGSWFRPMFWDFEQGRTCTKYLTDPPFPLCLSGPGFKYWRWVEPCLPGWQSCHSDKTSFPSDKTSFPSDKTSFAQINHQSFGLDKTTVFQSQWHFLDRIICFFTSHRIHNQAIDIFKPVPFNFYYTLFWFVYSGFGNHTM